jgi:hypothetical protein
MEEMTPEEVELRISLTEEKSSQIQAEMEESIRQISYRQSAKEKLYVLGLSFDEVESIFKDQ